MGTCCGKKPSRNRPVDKRGNSLRKYAYLHPHQKRILDAEDASNEESTQEVKEEEPKE